jgi:hypothetical protein
MGNTPSGGCAVWAHPRIGPITRELREAGAPWVVSPDRPWTPKGLEPYGTWIVWAPTSRAQGIMGDAFAWHLTQRDYI